LSKQLKIAHANSELCPMQLDIAMEKGIEKNHCTSPKALRLQQFLIVFSLANLFIVSLLGVVLRAYPFFGSIGLSYKNVLHGHSHFAFGGWVMPAILVLILRCFPHLEQTVSFRHWRNIGFLFLFSAYGMVIAFPLQGYKVVSISFSTLSILTGYYLAIVIWKAIRKLPAASSLRFLKWGLFYFALSSLGPFATGPLIAMGKTGSDLYYDVIYFYLHFQYNGWFAFAILSLLYHYLQQQKIQNNGGKVLQLLNLTCLPAYFLSVLWHQPSIVFNVIGGLAAIAQLYAGWLLIKDVSRCRFENKFIKNLLMVVLSAFVLKLILQALSALPSVALIAYQYRNFVIAYLHLVLLGCVSLFLLTWMIVGFKIQITKLIQSGLIIFLLAFLFSELLIIGLPLSAIFSFTLPDYTLSLLIVSALVPLAIVMFALSILKQVRTYNLPKRVKLFELASL
jgi:hypothetical protein